MAPVDGSCPIFLLDGQAREEALTLKCKRRSLPQLQAALAEEKSKRNLQKVRVGETQSYLTVFPCLVLSVLCFFLGRLQKLLYHATSTETATEAFHLLFSSILLG